MAKKIQTGTIDKNGNLSMYMEELRDFFKKHPNSKVIAEFTVLKKQASEPLKGYYFLSVVPQFKKAIWENGDRKTQEQTDEFLRRLSPIMYEEFVNTSSGKYDNRLKEINELSNPELVEFIEYLKQIGAEQFGIYIEDPKQF